MVRANTPPALSDSHVVGVYILQTEQGEVAWANVWKTQGGAVPSITDIYSLGFSQRLFKPVL